jgi:hypothetical protein
MKKSRSDYFSNYRSILGMEELRTGSQFSCFAEVLDVVLCTSVHKCTFLSFLCLSSTAPGIQTRLENKSLAPGIWFASLVCLLRSSGTTTLIGAAVGNINPSLE